MFSHRAIRITSDQFIKQVTSDTNRREANQNKLTHVLQVEEPSKKADPDGLGQPFIP